MGNIAYEYLFPIRNFFGYLNTFCVPSKVKDVNLKVFNLMSGLNESQYIFKHESCEYKCRFNESVSNSKQE